MCLFDTKVRSFTGYSSHCTKVVNTTLMRDTGNTAADKHSSDCCPTRSLANYVAHWAGIDCLDLKQEHADSALQLLVKCEPWYRNSSIKNCFAHQACQFIPPQCQDMLVFDSFYALIPKAFDPILALSDGGAHDLHISKMMYPLQVHSKRFESFMSDLHWHYLLPLYYRKDLPGGGRVEIAAYNMHNKYSFFGKVILDDITYAGVAFVIVYVMIWLHSGSLFVSSLAFMQIIAALGVAYTLYMGIIGTPCRCASFISAHRYRTLETHTNQKQSQPNSLLCA